MPSSNYIDDQRKSYSLYVLQSRAIPAIADGMKAGARRVLWTAKDGKKYKSATLAGATMPIHPHAAPEDAINTITGPYKNNIPLLHGDGAFGTALNPTAYGASRYTSVKVSQFTKDVVFKDIEIIPMQENYDGTLDEPVHFLPLVPTVLLNPSEGIAVGFASTILPRSLEDIVMSQILHLQGKKFDEAFPYFTPTNNPAVDGSEDELGKVRWTFEGDCKKVNSTTVIVTRLPYGTTHEKFINHLMKLDDNGSITDYTDGSRDNINIEIKFKRSDLDKLTGAKLKKFLGLINTISENLNVLSFDGQEIWSTNYNEIIKKFTDWRLGWYVNRYQRLADLLAIDIQKYKDILTAIRHNVGGQAKKISSRSELKEYLTEINIVHIDYIADLPVYRFTQEEKGKIEAKLKDANELMKTYKTLLKSEPERRKIYIQELKNVLKEFNKGTYNE